MEVIVTTLTWLTANWLRSACSSLVVIFLLDVIVRRVLRAVNFRQKIDQLPGPPAPNPILGNIPLEVLSLLTSTNSRDAGEFYTAQIQSLLGHTFIYKDEPLFRLWLGQEPVVCVWKPEMVQQVLGDNFLLDKSYHYDFLRPWLGNGLLTSPGKTWRPRRRLLVPSFHFNILQAFVGVFDQKSKLLVRNIKTRLAQAIEDKSWGIGSSELKLNGPKTETQAGVEGQVQNADRSIVVDITPIVTACTLDAICETIMGVSIEAQERPNNDYCKSVYVVGETFLERIIQPRYWLDIIFRHTELGKLYTYHLNKLHSFTRRVIAEKKRELLGTSSGQSENAADPSIGSPAKQTDCELVARLKVLEQHSVDKFTASKKNAPKLPKAFLDLLLDKVNLPGGMKLSDEEIREEVDTFMFEGHDTTAMALSWTLFLLGHNQEAQTRLQKEVDEFYAEHLLGEENEYELDQLKQLKYLDCVIKEALRLCPSVPFIGRQTSRELKLDKYTIPPGCVVFVLIYQLHRDKEIYPNPEQFNPDRFLPENTIGRHPFAYVPFSAGARNCIGQKFAMAEMKTILAHLVRNFTFESVTPLDKAKVQMEMVLRPKCALDIRVRSRTTDESIIDCNSFRKSIHRHCS